ncbi:heparinase II/III family protein [Thetidibacter halocola]|uniref:Heparinase II/III family protein n=1 Tax=Thetidibacter halocola TaxID=2827239 RepID=A0A8J7WEU0_9RHOB|nr:heparinase II/III family protein [Thetidibacter halocola]MBS0126322.1 heparinase II/III family protein [Thetidibacter halocola]
MADQPGLRARCARLLNGWHAWRAGREPAAAGFVSQPEPRSIGQVARGRQMLAGNLVLAGHVVPLEGRSPWDVPPPDARFADELQGFGWLDDLAALGEAEARRLAQDWVWDWIARYGRGRGPGWTPDLSGRRLIRLVHHALLLLRARDADQSAAYFRALAAQMRFLSGRAQAAAPGLPRFEAWCGLLYAALSTQGMERHVDPARRALAAECARQVGADGGIPTRSPEELLEVFTLLTWVRLALDAAHQPVEPAIEEAIRRIAPVLRLLRHADGGLARFHGGGRGVEGRLDAALSASGMRRRAVPRQAMGFARLSAGRTSVIVDAAPPPSGPASAEAHASTLAFELTSGRRPLIVNCGTGRAFGEEWHRAGRASPSHSTLSLQGYSSARLVVPRRGVAVGVEWLENGPTAVQTDSKQGAEGQRFEGAHDAYVSLDGLTHARSLQLVPDGRELQGEDFLVALDDAAKARFDAAMSRAKLAGIAYDIRFHLHPEVDVALDMGGAAVSMALRSGEIWILRVDPGTEIELQPSVYFDQARIQPRATKQIVLSGRAMEYATRVRWTLAKAQDTALAVRDLAMETADALT